MFLKRLEITGFKSFAARTVLDFEKPNQITAIVGPNGSGKSNIADSIRWALGETSYKSLRSKKSEDVIFSGSEAKNRASMAKVSLLLDNSDKKAPIDFSEVSIARSVFRDGSSEYLVAGKKSRLLDVAELLAKSGFGQSTYTVLGQGMVDSMLFYGPAERKVLFDEAAGVRAYELKREQTLKKLEDTNTNLIRIRDILSELSPRLSILKKQALRSKEKDTVKESLIEKQKIYYSTLWDRLNLTEKEKRSDLEKVSNGLSEVQQEINDLNEKFNEILNTEKNSGVDTNTLAKQIDILEEQKDEFRQKIFTLRAKLELSGSQLSKKELEQKISELQKQIEESILDKLIKQKETIEKELKAHSEQDIQAKINELENKKDQIRQSIFELKNQLNISDNKLSKHELEEKIRQLRTEHDNLNEKDISGRIRGLEKEITRSEENINQLEKEIRASREKLKVLSEKLADVNMGQVGEQISAILYLQNDFVIQIESAKTIKEVEKTISTGKQVSERLKELRKIIGDSKENRVTQITEIQNNLEKLLTEKEQLTKEINHKKSEIFRNDFELKKIGDRKFEIEKELGILADEKPITEKDLKKVNAEIESCQKELNDLDFRIQKYRETINAKSVQKGELTNIEYRISTEEVNIEKIKSEISRLEQIKPADDKEKKEIEENINKYQTEIAKINNKIDEQRQKLNEASNTLSGQGKKLSDTKDAISGKQSLAAEYNQAITTLRVDLARLETKKQDIKEEIVREMGNEEGLGNAKVLPELNEEQARSEIEKLKNKLYVIGEIDPEIEGEYAEVSERVEFMDTQTTDLEKAKEDLEKLIKELDGKIKKQFEGSFEAISKKFSHFFETLFEGGTAKLELVKTKNEEEEKEEFGIEITAVPPGKRVKSLSALSGGERTMTSLALLFAILSVNPSPFCVLDEVDAALDESNTKRFLKIITELSASTQFIFITHNRETMKIASVIYGVTMDDSHASKLLSIKLDDAIAVVHK